jgi:hypothetical protein
VDVNVDTTTPVGDATTSSVAHDDESLVNTMPNMDKLALLYQKYTMQSTEIDRSVDGWPGIGMTPWSSTVYCVMF